MAGSTDASPAVGTEDARLLRELGQQLRADRIRCSTAAGSGHPASGMSAADLMAVLLARHLRYDWHKPHEPGNDHLIFSTGRASPLLYAIFKAAGAITDEELVRLCAAYATRRQASTSVVALRYFTVYGPRQRPDIAISRILLAAMSGRGVPLCGTAGNGGTSPMSATRSRQRWPLRPRIRRWPWSTSGRGAAPRSVKCLTWWRR